MNGSSRREYKWLKCIKTYSASFVLRETQIDTQT